eukprot:19268-Pleurochrysis_carterae.AAC.1
MERHTQEAHAHTNTYTRAHANLGHTRKEAHGTPLQATGGTEKTDCRLAQRARMRKSVDEHPKHRYPTQSFGARLEGAEHLDDERVPELQKPLRAQTAFD